MTDRPRRALVLAGGGVAGIAWETGVLAGIADVDPGLAADLQAADLVIGTSAGSAVAAQVTGGTPLAELVDRQLAVDTAELTPAVDFPVLLARLQEATSGLTGAVEVRRAIARVALAADTVTEADRLAVIRARLPRHTWPTDRDVRVVAVDAATGERTVLTGASGVPLVDAVAASCAVPGIWPPVTIGETRYVDGGVWSVASADLAAGADVVVVLVPAAADAPPVAGRPLADELAELAALADPPAVHVVYADAASVEAFGTDPLAPSTRAPSLLAGRAQGRAVAATVAAAWR